VRARIGNVFANSEHRFFIVLALKKADGSDAAIALVWEWFVEPKGEVDLMAKRELVLVVVAIVALTSIAASVAALRGALWIPHNDDWVYLHMAQWANSRGEFIVESGSLTNAVGLVVLAQPVMWIFGDSVLALQAFVAVLGMLALFISWLVLRSFLSSSTAAIAGEKITTLHVTNLIGEPFDFWAVRDPQRCS
jgi:hypothetical protein